MNLFLAIIQFILISMIFIKEVKWKSPGMFLWATLFLMFGSMHLFDIIIGASKYKENSLINASLFVIIFCFFYFITRFFLRQKFPVRIDKTFLNISLMIRQNEKHTAILFFLLILTTFMITGYIITQLGGILNTSWGDSREVLLHRNYLSGEQIWMILYYALGGLLCCSIIKKSVIGSLISFCCMGFVELVTRNRVLILPLLVSIIAFFAFKMKKIRLSTILIAAVGAVIVIYVVYAIRAFRWLGDLNSAIQEFDVQALNAQIKTFFVTSDGELGLRNWMYYFIEKDNQFENFGRGHTYIRMLLIYVPTKFSAGLKPPDFALTMGTAVGMLEGGSMHPTLFGDCFANLGYAGVLLGVLWALVIHINDVIIDKMKCYQIKVLAFVLLSTSYVIIGRGAVYSGFFAIAWGIPLLMIMSASKLEIPKIRFYCRKVVRYDKK